MAENEIGRGRDRTGAVAGGYGIAGGFGGYARVTDLKNLFQAALSNDVTACAFGATGNKATIVPTAYLNFYTIEKNVGDTLYLWLINAKLNSLTLTVGQGEIAAYSSDWVVTTEKTLSEGEVEDLETPSYADDDLLAFHGGLLKIGDDQYNNMESVEIALNNNLSNDEYTVRPSRFLNDVTEGARTIDLNFSQVFQTAEDYSNYTYGKVGALTPTYSLFEDSVEFTLMNSQELTSATEYINFKFPRVMFGGLPVTLTSGRITVSNTGTVLMPSTGNIVTIEVKA